MQHRGPVMKEGRIEDGREAAERQQRVAAVLVAMYGMSVNSQTVDSRKRTIDCDMT